MSFFDESVYKCSHFNLSVAECMKETNSELKLEWENVKRDRKYLNELIAGNKNASDFFDLEHRRFQVCPVHIDKIKSNANYHANNPQYF